MNKNWNDRADKDLFFTILSVKNIGVISGAEWTTIGNQMRSLGYGFTNEGCRQHFQGLRRAQHKTEPNGSGMDTQRKADPTANPITRRPGPGRPRRAQSSATFKADELDFGQTPKSETKSIDPLASSPFQKQTPARTLSSGKEESSLESDLEEQPSKRQRLDIDVEDRQTNEDEAVLALAADGITSAADAYDPPE
ncbi:hypothetical protein GGS21DRAFT_493594 [Xylaria nigripes]|nr:hypothetical protein GGS21DRAFT_493594 [Xylaria nigripes]